jgi:hypothetical protein
VGAAGCYNRPTETSANLWLVALEREIGSGGRRLSLSVLALLACLLGSQAAAFASTEAFDHDTSGYRYDVEANTAQLDTGGSHTSALHHVERQGNAKPYVVSPSYVYDSSPILVAPNSANMDSFLPNSSTVSHSGTATAIGDDAATMTNFGRSQGSAGHDVIVHGQMVDGEAFFMTNGLPTHPQQIADAVLSNPAYAPGSPVELVTCHGACGLADELSTALGGVPVSASPYRVQIDPVTGLLLEAKP